jgi:D-alanyl-D-alanine carboxypeptidase
MWTALQRLAAAGLASFCLAAQSSAPAIAGPAFLYEPATGTVLFAEDPDQSWHPASVTKLMTAYVTFAAVEAGHLAWDSDVPLSAYARSQPATRIGLRGGIPINVEQAIRGVILRSANDFATALAERVSGSEEYFVEAMNATAQRLGMTRTVFRNPHGLPDPDQVTTARDLARLTSALLKDFPQRAEVFSTPTVRIHKGTFYSQNDLMRTLPGSDGMKTGFTCASGYNVVASATRDGRKLIAIVLGAMHRQERSARASALLEAGFAHLGIEAPVADASSTMKSPVHTVPRIDVGSLMRIAFTDLALSPAAPKAPEDIGRKIRSGQCRGYAGFQKPVPDVISGGPEPGAEAIPATTASIPTRPASVSVAPARLSASTMPSGAKPGARERSAAAEVPRPTARPKPARRTIPGSHTRTRSTQTPAGRTIATAGKPDAPGSSLPVIPHPTGQ